MNIKTRITAMAGTLAVLFALAAGCGTTAGGGDSPGTAGGEDSPESPAGGPDFGLTILAPQGKNLGPDDSHLPDLVMGVISADFTKYSDIKVRDWASLSKALEEMERLMYEENSDSIEVGKIARSEYVLSGELVKQGGTNYFLRLTISDTAAGNNRAAYTGNCALADLDNNTAIRQASAELLTQMGVRLNDSARAELGLVNERDARARQVMAKGAAAQRSGTVVEAMSYYFQAAAIDPLLMASAEWLSVLASTEIASGNIGKNVRDDIQQRAGWVKLLNECEAYFRSHLPFELVYVPELTRVGEIDFKSGTVDLAFEARLMWVDSAYSMLSGLKRGLEQTGKAREWELAHWMPDFESYEPRINTVQAVLINENGKSIGSGNFRVSLPFSRGYGFDILRPVPPGPRELGMEGRARYKEVFVGSGYALVDTWQSRQANSNCLFTGVNANDITDKLSIRITQAAGMDAAQAAASGYMRISAVSADWLYPKIPDLDPIPLSRDTIAIGRITAEKITKITIPEEIAGRRKIFISLEFGNGLRGLSEIIFPDTVIGIDFVDGGRFLYSAASKRRVRMPAGLELGEFEKKFMGGVYQKNGRKAGVYTSDGREWTGPK